MPSLFDYIELNKNFQKSVNLQMDLIDKAKGESYIPTRASVHVLKQLLAKVVETHMNHASILIGPYGKGKSHLLLVLLHILMGNIELSKKFTDFDMSLEGYFKYLENKKYLPVIISTTTDDLNQAFLIALSDALYKCGVQKIIPDTYYSEAMRVIHEWEKDFPQAYERFQKILEYESYSVEQILKGLKSYNKNILEIFSKTYQEVTFGTKFNPLISAEMTEVYTSVNNKLCEQYGYQGMYIVFDEFSKYVEGHGEETFSRDMAVLQKVCEMTERSLNRICLTLVAHKNIRSYGDDLPRSVRNAFRGIEGRLEEILFVSSAQNSFELIQNAIGHKEGFEIYYERNNFTKESYEKIPVYRQLFADQQLFTEIVGKGCYPLLPVVAYILLVVSEKVAQNERTVFTFLTNNEPNSLYRLLKNGIERVTAAHIYDYFENDFRENTKDFLIHSEWLKADYALGQTDIEDEKILIKTVAMISIVNRPDEIISDKKTLYLASGIRKEFFKQTISELENKEILIIRKNNLYSFKANVGVDLNQEIKRVIDAELTRFDLCKALQENTGLDYLIPKKYNQQYAMTRFFQFVFMTTESFLTLGDPSYLREKGFADGYILIVLKSEESDIEEIVRHSRELNCDTIVILYTNEDITCIESLKRLLAVRKLLANTQFIENNQILVQELKLYEADMIYELEEYAQERFLPINNSSQIIYKDMVRKSFSNIKEFNRYVSDICIEVFHKTVIINNELVNKEELSSPYARAQRIVINKFLNGESLEQYKKGTNQEATLFRVAYLHTGLTEEYEKSDSLQSVLKEIRNFFVSCEGEKHSFESICCQLKSAPYGMRSGVLPIIFSYIFRQLQADMPVVYQGSQQLSVLDADCLQAIVETPEKYELFVERGTEENKKYVNTLFEIMGATENIGFTSMQNISYLVELIQKWYRSLPQSSRNHVELSVDIWNSEGKGLKTYLKNVNLNPHEFVFQNIPSAFYVNSYEEAAKEFKKYKEVLDNHENALKKLVANKTREVFHGKRTDGLNKILSTWYGQQSEKARNYVLSTRMNSLMSYICNLSTHDEGEIADSLAKIILDVYIGDWKENFLNQYERELILVKNEIQNIKDTKVADGESNIIKIINSSGNVIEKYYNEVEESAGYFLKNSLENVLAEFDNVETNQKVSVLVELLTNLMKQ